MKLLFVVVLVAFSFKVGAQYQPQAHVQPTSDRLIFMQKLDHYKRVKTAGIVMTVIGATAFIIGAAEMGGATYTTNAYGQQTSNDPQALTGALLVIGGAGFLGAGIPLTIVGSHKVKQIQRKLDGLSMKLNIKPQQAGLALTYKF